MDEVLRFVLVILVATAILLNQWKSMAGVGE